MNIELFKISLQTVTANRWDLTMAKLFGKKVVTEDSGCTVTMHYWRGKAYMTDVVWDKD